MLAEFDHAKHLDDSGHCIRDLHVQMNYIAELYMD